MAETAAAAAGRYWCHMCAVSVSPTAAEGEAEIKCPYCHSGFLEEMETARSGAADGGGVGGGNGADPSADGAISVWAPIIDSMVSNPVRRRRNRRPVDAGADDDYDLDNHEFSRRRRRATAFLRLLQAIREHQLQRLESAAAVGSVGVGVGVSLDVEHYSPFGRSIFAAGPGGEHGLALGDYFLGPGLDALMQQLAESDVSRQGTPPAKKEAVEAMPTVEVIGGGGCDDDDDTCVCAVCLDGYASGERAREMPCRHRFHSKCILPWLEMHSSCPVCRFQLPADDEPKGGSGAHSGDINGNANHGDAGNASLALAVVERDGGVEGDGSGSRLPASIQWLNSLFAQQGQGQGPGPSPSPSSPPAPAPAPASTSGSSSQHCDD